MAISNYANLKASIGDFLNRSDLATDQSDGSTVIEKFIELAEAEFNRRLRVRSMVTRSTITVNSQYTDLSTDLTDYLELKNITLEPTSGGLIVWSLRLPRPWMSSDSREQGPPEAYLLRVDRIRVGTRPGTRRGLFGGNHLLQKDSCTL